MEIQQYMYLILHCSPLEILPILESMDGQDLMMVLQSVKPFLRILIPVQMMVTEPVEMAMVQAMDKATVMVMEDLWIGEI